MALLKEHSPTKLIITIASLHTGILINYLKCSPAEFTAVEFTDETQNKLDMKTKQTFIVAHFSTTVNFVCLLSDCERFNLAALLTAE